MWITKKQLKKEVDRLQNELYDSSHLVNECKYKIAQLRAKVNEYERLFPFTFGQTVYDVQLRNSKGRFTKTKACKEFSMINEVVVDDKNYFKLVARLNAKDVFVTRDEAVNRLNEVCVD